MYSAAGADDTLVEVKRGGSLTHISQYMCEAAQCVQGLRGFCAKHRLSRAKHLCVALSRGSEFAKFVQHLTKVGLATDCIKVQESKNTGEYSRSSFKERPGTGEIVEFGMLFT